MQTPWQSELNPRTVLRYDRKHVERDSSGGFSYATEQAPLEAGNADMEITGSGATHGAIPLRPTRTSSETKAPVGTPSTPVRDEVEISSSGQALERASNPSDLRAEHLARIKAAIEAGEYETPQKLEAALDRMFGELGFGD